MWDVHIPMCPSTTAYIINTHTMYYLKELITAVCTINTLGILLLFSHPRELQLLEAFLVEDDSVIIFNEFAIIVGSPECL